MSSLEKVFGLDKYWKGWPISLALYLGAYIVVLAALTFSGTKSWWIPFHIGLAAGIANMGFMRERDIGSGGITLMAPS